MTRKIFLWALLALACVSSPAMADSGQQAKGLAIKAQVQALSASSLRDVKDPLISVAVGDSLTAAANDNTYYIRAANGYTNILEWMSGGRIVFRAQHGVPGNQSYQIAIRSSDEALNYPGVKALWLLEGTNDVGNSVAQAVTIANDRAQIRAAQSRGLAAFLLSIPPRCDVGGYTATVRALNAAKKVLAAQEGATFIDIYTALDDGNGCYKAGLSSDGIHPLQPGVQAMVRAILANPTVQLLIPTHAARSMVQTGEMASPIPNAQFLITNSTSATGATGTQASQYTFYGTTTGYTLSMLSDPTIAPNGQLQRFVLGGSVTSSVFFDSAAVDISLYAGRRIRYSCFLRTSGVAASGVSVSVRLLGSDAIEGLNFSMTPMNALSLDGAGYVYGEAPVPAGSTTATARLQITAGSGAATVDYGDCSIAPVVEARGLIDTRSSKVPRRVRNVTATGNITLDDEIVLCDATSGAVTLTLPPFIGVYGNGSFAAYNYSQPSGGLSYTVVKTDASANACAVAPPSPATINGSTSPYSITTQNAPKSILATSANRYFAW